MPATAIKQKESQLQTKSNLMYVYDKLMEVLDCYFQKLMDLVIVIPNKK